MKILFSKRVLLIIFFLVLSFISFELFAQCPMCRMSAESNLANGGTEGRGLNKGILYMLSLPYLIVGVLGFLWYKNKRKKQEELLQK